MPIRQVVDGKLSPLKLEAWIGFQKLHSGCEKLDLLPETPIIAIRTGSIIITDITFFFFILGERVAGFEAWTWRSSKQRQQQWSCCGTAALRLYPDRPSPMGIKLLGLELIVI